MRTEQFMNMTNPMACMGFSNTIRNILSRMGCKTLEDFLSNNEIDYLTQKGCGESAWLKIRTKQRELFILLGRPAKFSCNFPPEGLGSAVTYEPSRTDIGDYKTANFNGYQYRRRQSKRGITTL
jgi:hypothetical protein